MKEKDNKENRNDVLFFSIIIQMKEGRGGIDINVSAKLQIFTIYSYTNLLYTLKNSTTSKITKYCLRIQE